MGGGFVEIRWRLGRYAFGLEQPDGFVQQRNPVGMQGGVCRRKIFQPMSSLPEQIRRVLPRTEEALNGAALETELEAVVSVGKEIGQVKAQGSGGGREASWVWNFGRH